MTPALISRVNEASAAFVAGYAWPLTWQASFLILLIALAAQTLFRRASPRCHYILWCLVLIRIMLPPTLDLPTSVAHWGIPAVERNTAALGKFGTVPSEKVRDRALGMSQNFPVFSFSMVDSTSHADLSQGLSLSTGGSSGKEDRRGRRSYTQPPQPEGPSLSFASLLLAFWLLGVAGLLLLLAVRLGRHKRLLSHSQPAPPVVEALVAECQERLGIGWRTDVRCVEGLLTPIACGVSRPRIVLPAEVVATMGLESLRPVIMHELVHIKRRDAAVNWLQLALGIAHFYNPLVWYANRRIRAERERVCDDCVLMALDLDRETYAASLVMVARHSQASGLFAPGYVGVVEKKSNLRSRIGRILNHHIQPTARLSLVSVLALIVFAASFGTFQAASNTEDNPVPEQVIKTSDIKAAEIAPGKGIDKLAVGATRTEIESLLGKPEEVDAKGQYLSYHEKYCLNFWLGKDERILEMRFNEGFEGRTRGDNIGIGSHLDDVLAAHGGAAKTVRTSDSDTVHGVKEGANRVLYEQIERDRTAAYKFIDANRGILYWMDKNAQVIQIVVFRPSVDKERTDIASSPPLADVSESQSGPVQTPPRKTLSVEILEPGRAIRISAGTQGASLVDVFKEQTRQTLRLTATLHFENGVDAASFDLSQDPSRSTYAHLSPLFGFGRGHDLEVGRSSASNIVWTCTGPYEGTLEFDLDGDGSMDERVEISRSLWDQD